MDIRRIQSSDVGACVCVWQEYCDRGNLDRAVTAGIFRRINGWPDLVSPSDHLMSGLEGLIHCYCVNCGWPGLVRCGRSWVGFRTLNPNPKPWPLTAQRLPPRPSCLCAFHSPG